LTDVEPDRPSSGVCPPPGVLLGWQLLLGWETLRFTQRGDNSVVKNKPENGAGIENQISLEINGILRLSEISRIIRITVK
jgi:hypothetical protein